MLTLLLFDAFANKSLLTVRLRYFRAYIHIDVIVKSLQLWSMHAEVRICLERSY
jgi:hypothetical protein